VAWTALRLKQLEHVAGPAESDDAAAAWRHGCAAAQSLGGYEYDPDEIPTNGCGGWALKIAA
jgi:hypothetical protein